MAKKEISNLLDSSLITQELKEAYAFLLLAKGYSADDIKILDDYVFIVRKKNNSELNEVDANNLKPRIRRKRNQTRNLISITSSSEAYNKKDHTLYTLNSGELTTKGRLVWLIIRLYQEEYNPTYEEVSNLFNNKLHLLRNTIIDKQSLDNLRPDRQKRFYYNESDILKSKDGIQYVVSNQWSIDKMDEIISFARSKGWKIEVIKKANSI